MGVYVPRMKMPSSCWKCDLKQEEDEKHWCPFMVDAIEDELIDIYRNRTRRKDCPLVEVPKHGYLIDADALGIGYESRKAFTVPEYADGWNDAVRCINNAPTVIESED